MNHKLLAYNNKIFLCEPSRLQQLAVRAASIPTCPTARELAVAAREWRERAARISDDAIQGTGVDDPAEFLTGLIVKPHASAPKSIRAVKGKIGVIHIFGPVGQRYSNELEKAGGTPLDYVSAGLDNLLANAGVGAVVLQFDSPGGEVGGVEELSNKIYNARAEKPIYAIADSFMASASFWIGSAATMMIATLGGEVGSHGVYCMHIDQSKLLEKDGLAVTLVSAGKYKTELSPYGPLGDDAKASLQKSVDATMDKFTDALRRNRGVSADKVRSDYGQGRVMNADDALAAGVIDRIMTMEELLGKLIGAGSSGSGQAKAALLRMKQEQRKRMAH